MSVLWNRGGWARRAGPVIGAVVVGILSLGGCEYGTGGSSGAPEPSDSPGNEPDGLAPLDACQLFDGEAAKAVLGESVGEAKQEFVFKGGPTQSPSVMSNCAYSAAGSDRSVSVLVRRLVEGKYDREDVTQTQSELDPLTEDGPGPDENLGDHAFWSAPVGPDQVQLNVFHGSDYLVITTNGFEGREGAMDAAREAARRLLQAS